MTGKASGRGFYDYSKETPRDAREGVTETVVAPVAPFVVSDRAHGSGVSTQSLRVDEQIVVYSCPTFATKHDVDRVLELARTGQVVVDSSDGLWRQVAPGGRRLAEGSSRRRRAVRRGGC